MLGGVTKLPCKGVLNAETQRGEDAERRISKEPQRTYVYLSLCLLVSLSPCLVSLRLRASALKSPFRSFKLLLALEELIFARNVLQEALGVAALR